MCTLGDWHMVLMPTRDTCRLLKQTFTIRPLRFGTDRTAMMSVCKLYGRCEYYSFHRNFIATKGAISRLWKVYLPYVLC